MDGKDVIDAGEMVEKVRAAVEARGDDGPLIIARTDARAVEGLDAALERARRYRDAGADVLFVEAPETEAEIEAVAAAFPDVPLVFNWVDGGKTPQLPVDRIRELGFALVIFPVTTLFAAGQAVADVLARIGEHDVPTLRRLHRHDRAARGARARGALRQRMTLVARRRPRGGAACSTASRTGPR